MLTDIARRRRTHFVLWRPGSVAPAPRIVFGTFVPGNPPAWVQNGDVELRALDGHEDLWGVPALDCGLVDGRVYHYWFEITDTHPERSGSRIRVTDPMAATVDWRIRAPRLQSPYTDDDRDPAAVLLWKDGALVACDAGGGVVTPSSDSELASRPTNNRLVVYELPTAWATRTDVGGVEIGVGTFRDTRALVDTAVEAANFGGVEVFEGPGAYLVRLGVNALELLPPADSWVFREWGYATCNYFAADFDLGFPNYHASPTSMTDFAALVASCHARGIRTIVDVVMAFATRYVYEHVNYLDFHVLRGAPGRRSCDERFASEDPEDRDHDGRCRQDFGGRLFKFGFFVDAYDPVSGERRRLSPARQLLIANLLHWLETYRVDGFRVDSTKNIVSWDFLSDYRTTARAAWLGQWTAAGLPAAEADSRFIVVGEELPPRLGLVTTGRLDGLWNEPFLERVRCAVLGERFTDDGSFQQTVERLVDCRQLGYPDLAAAVNYVTSHDVEGFRKERLFRFLFNNGLRITGGDGGDVPDMTAIVRRCRLAFVCLLTSVGIPMILAGEEFADDHDRAVTHPAKQSDPVNFDRLGDPERAALQDYVARLVRARTTLDALSVNDTTFLHADFTDGKRVVVWRRGGAGQAPVVVVANFSAFRSDEHGTAPFEYRVPNWPSVPGARWREITQVRDVPDEWVGREPIFPWEAKVYTTA